MVGFRTEIVRLSHRCLASYLRAIVAGVAAMGLGASTGWVDAAAMHQFVLVATSALAAPLLVFLTETADLLEPKP